MSFINLRVFSAGYLLARSPASRPSVTQAYGVSPNRRGLCGGQLPPGVPRGGAMNRKPLTDAQ